MEFIKYLSYFFFMLLCMVKLWFFIKLMEKERSRYQPFQRLVFFNEKMQLVKEKGPWSS